MRIAFIGLGNMGAPMAERLLAQGYRVQLHDVRADAGAALIRAGGEWADSLAALAEQAEMICTCLPGPAQAEAVFLGPGGLVDLARPDVIFVDHTTNDPELVKVIGKALGERAAHLLDAPLDGGREGALNGELNLFVGGEDEVFGRARRVLECSARSVTHVGALGAGSVTKIVHNALAMSIDLLLTECLTLGVKSGVSLPALVEAFGNGCIVAENMTFKQRMPATLFRGDFDARFALRLAEKDFGLARALSEHAGVPTQILDLCAGELAQSLANGWGESDRTRASQLQEIRAGVELRLPRDD